MATAMASSRQEKIGDFLVTKDEAHQVGVGAYGRVYIAERVSYEQTVAAKKTTGYKEELDMEAFEHEADLLLNKILPHPNIVKVYDVVKTEYEEGGIQMVDLWIITELCEQGDLQKFAQKTELTIHQKLDLMCQSACALQHLHCCKPDSIAHRDIKPQNFLVAGRADKPTIRLSDFGCSRTVMRKKGRLVSMKSMAGTSSYWAPEQNEIRHRPFSYNKTVDIFSLGLTFLALLEAIKGSLMKTKTGKSLFYLPSNYLILVIMLYQKL